MSRMIKKLTITIFSILALAASNSWAQGLGVNIAAPVSMLHVYENTANTGIVAGVTVEQDGVAGDAVVQLLLTGGQRWAMGIDQSDASKFKIATAAAAAAADLSTNNLVTITTTGDVGIGSTVTAPKELLQIGESAASASKLHIEGNDAANYSASIILQDQTQASPSGEVEFGYFDVDDSFRLELANTRVVSQIQGTDDFDIAGTVVGGFGMIDIDMTTTSAIADDYAAILVAANPSDNTVRLRVNSSFTENIGTLDNAANWEAWANFGVPDGGAGDQIMSVSVSISNHLDGMNFFAVAILARMDDGTVYIRTTNNDNTNLANVDNIANYGLWVSLGNDGFK